MQTVTIQTPADRYSMKVEMELMAKWRCSYIVEFIYKQEFEKAKRAQ